jgi:hypothetical protein
MHYDHDDRALVHLFVCIDITLFLFFSSPFSENVITTLGVAVRASLL